MNILENSSLKIAVKNKGAELCSLFSKHTQMEYLWQAGKEWAKHAPVLFPVVGQLKNNSYHYHGKSYNMERHGFARTMDFSLSEKKQDTITFTLQEQESTLSVYPFNFRLNITYKITDNQLEVIYDVANTGKKEMPFSIGAHPAFNVPLSTHENYRDYYLQFNKVENAGRWLLQEGLLSEEITYFNKTEHLPLTKELFSNDALVFKKLKSDRIELRNNNHHHGVAVNFNGFPYMGLWAAHNADFVCIEPWHGIADSVNTNGNILEKEGIIILNQGENYLSSYTIEVF
ncbi:MAG: aldose 1-epimerase family protein [Bacteroidetes bacterium]|jgi:galactose mutarotase-like enzyme|nr:aldose 1-epimerase family protein [Bacteroidota bacterium]